MAAVVAPQQTSSEQSAVMVDTAAQLLHAVRAVLGEGVQDIELFDREHVVGDREDEWGVTHIRRLVTDRLSVEVCADGDRTIQGGDAFLSRITRLEKGCPIGWAFTYYGYCHDLESMTFFDDRGEVVLKREWADDCDNNLVNEEHYQYIDGVHTLVMQATSHDFRTYKTAVLKVAEAGGSTRDSTTLSEHDKYVRSSVNFYSLVVSELYGGTPWSKPSLPAVDQSVLVTEARSLLCDNAALRACIERAVRETQLEILHKRNAQLTRSQLDARIHAKRPWDIELFKLNSNWPLVVGHVPDNALTVSSWQKYRWLDMPIYMPDKGWSIPDEIEALIDPALQLALAHETLINPEVQQHYVYVTLDQKSVAPMQTQRRPGWHSDSYEKSTNCGRPTDSVYLVFDTLSTEFLPGPFSLDGIDPDACEQVLSALDMQAAHLIQSRLAQVDPKLSAVVTYTPGTVLHLDPFVVHRGAVNTTHADIDRTFLKISFSTKQYNRAGNTLNPAFEYDWTMVPRDQKTRNHPSI